MKLKPLFAAALIACAIVFTTGCGTTQTTPQASHSAKAVAYLTFFDVWTVTHAAYQGACDATVQGKISAKDKADIDKAWNAYRGAFTIALEAAQMDTAQVTPDNVRKLASDLLTLINAAL